MPTRMHTHRHARTHTHTHARTHAHTHTCIRKKHSCTQTCTHTHARIHARTHARPPDLAIRVEVHQANELLDGCVVAGDAGCLQRAAGMASNPSRMTTVREWRRNISTHTCAEARMEAHMHTHLERAQQLTAVQAARAVLIDHATQYGYAHAHAP